jgi:glutaredoxin 3
VANVIVYSTDPCSFCTRAKQLLQARKVPFQEINLAKDPAGRMELVERTGMLSFPQIVIDDELIGGFQELIAADRSGRLTELVSRAA